MGIKYRKRVEISWEFLVFHFAISFFNRER